MDVVHRQRARLCDLVESLSDAQWSAETLCDGWDAEKVVAHLLVREREPWASAGLVIPPLSSLHDKRIDVRARADRATLQADLRDGPPLLWRLGPLGDVQVAEDYIHGEDIRRGGAASVADGASLTPDDGTRDPEVEDLLWTAVGRFAPLTLGGVRGDGAVALTDGSRSRAYRVGGRFARPVRGQTPARTVSVTGPVGDLLLWVTGRRETSAVVDGPEDLTTALSRARRGV